MTLYMQIQILLLISLLIFLIYLRPSIQDQVGGLSTYNNICLTCKPYGTPGTENIYNYWKNIEKRWRKEYAPYKIKQSGDVRETHAKSSLCNSAATNSHSIGLNYYHDPVAYCKVHPDRYPCPNYWLVKRDSKNADFKGIDSDFTHASGDMSLKDINALKPYEAVRNGDFEHTLDKNINDNYHTRIINTEREDHGLCGNKCVI